MANHEQEKNQFDRILIYAKVDLPSRSLKGAVLIVCIVIVTGKQ